MPLPTVDGLWSELGGANVFSTMDLVSEFFQCSIHEDSIPLTAVCTPGGFSLLCYVCDGFKRVHLFINDIVFFSKNGAEHVDDLERFLERLTIFNLKLAPKKAHIRIRVILSLIHI